MRATFQMLTKDAQNAVVDDTDNSPTTLLTAKGFLEREINNTCDYLMSLLRDYKVQPLPRTITTEADTVYYKNFPGLIKIESATIDIGTHVPLLRIIDSQEQWDQLQQIPVASGLPTAIFPRRDDFGIYPTPQGAYTVTIAGTYSHVNMTASDITSGTISTTVSDATVTGSSTTFTSAKAGYWLAPATDGVQSGNWYRILSVTSDTALELDRTWSDNALSASEYIIGQSPELPPELHEFIPYRAAASYYALRRKDMKAAQPLLNYFFTGDYNNTMREGNSIKGGVLFTLKDLAQRGRGNSNIVYMGDTVTQNYMRDGIFGLTLTAP